MENNLKRKVFSGLFWKFGERFSSQIISLLISIILARLLSPADYGAVALVMVFITIANVFVVNGLGNALIQKSNISNIEFSSVLYINFFISIILYFIIFIFSSHISGFYNMPILSPALKVLGLQIIIASINSVQQAYVSRNMLFKRFFWSTSIGTCISGIIGIVMAYNGFGIWALIFQYLSNTCIGTLVLWFTVKWRPIFAFSWEKCKPLISYGWKLLVSALLDTGYNQLRNLVIGKLYNAKDLAYYNQGDKYPNLLVTNINSSISSVLFPAMSLYQNEPQMIKKLTRKAISISSFVMWPAMIGFIVISEPLIVLVLTEKWLPCVPYLQVLCLYYGLWPIHTANLQALNALGRSDIYLKLEILKKAIGIVALVISIPFGPLAFAWSLVLTGIISTFINAAPNIKLFNYIFLEQLRDLLPPFFISIVMAIIIFPLKFLITNNFFLIVLQVSIGSVIYIVISYFTKQDSLKFILNLIRKRKNG